MPDENPYHSPQVDSTPHAVAEDSTLRRRPTWRLWVLALIGLPTLIGLLIQIAIVASTSESFALRVLLIPVELLILLIYSGAIFVVARKGRRSQQPGSFSGNHYGFKIAAIVILALIAVPSAFFNTCTPISFAGGSWSYSYWEGEQNKAGTGIFVSIAIGVIVGIICTILTVRLAYHLWRDAVEGLPKSTGRETIIRPNPRLQAKKPDSDNS